MQDENDAVFAPITDANDLFDYLVKVTDTRLGDDIAELVRSVALDPERRLTIDGALATLATVLAMHLIAAPEPDDMVKTKAGWLAYFIHTQVSASRHMRTAMNGEDDATHH